MNKLKALWKRLTTDTELIRYLVIGVLTTLIDYGVFALLTLGAAESTGEWQMPQVISWFAAVVFAYFGNKFFVFSSKAESRDALIREAASFFLMRLVSLGLSWVLMFLLVDLLHVHMMIAKIIANVVVVLSNYVFSKLVIFVGKKRPESTESPSDSESRKE